MEVILLDRRGKEIEGQILMATRNDVKKLKDWNFNWDELFSKKSTIYKLQLKDQIIGLVKHHWENEEHFNLANIELSPRNIGSKGQYKNAADLLFAYSALQSFKIYKKGYKGFLAFKSKGKLINHYVKKYKAELVFRDRMIISPRNCKILIKENLKIEI